MKMYFYYGVMGSSKTANALMTWFSWEEKGKRAVLLKPSIDTREGAAVVRSRSGLSAPALLIEPQQKINEVLPETPDRYDNLIVDEAQFLTAAQVDELREIADSGTFVMCYGLKTDFRGLMFEGSKRLLEVADSLREVVTMCPCGKKATMNARYVNDHIVYEGEQVVIGGNEAYVALCHRCYKKGMLTRTEAGRFVIQKDSPLQQTKE